MSTPAGRTEPPQRLELVPAGSAGRVSPARPGRAQPPRRSSAGWQRQATALAGVHVFLRRVDPQKILHLIREHSVSHLCGAPIVLNALVNMPESAKAAIDHPVNAMAAGAALYILVERSHLLRFASSHDKTGGAPETD